MSSYSFSVDIATAIGVSPSSRPFCGAKFPLFHTRRQRAWQRFVPLSRLKSISLRVLKRPIDSRAMASEEETSSRGAPDGGHLERRPRFETSRVSAAPHHEDGASAQPPQ